MTNSNAIEFRPSVTWVGRWSLVGSGLVIHSMLGVLFSWSAFLYPLRSAYGWDTYTALAPYRYALISFAVGLLLAVRLAERRSPRNMARIGGLLMTCGCLWAALAGPSIEGIVLGIGLLGGAGAGFAYLAPLAVFQHWVPQYRDAFLGLTTACFAGSAFVFRPLLRSILGDSVVMYPETIPTAFWAMACISLVGVALAGELLPSSRVWLAPRIFQTLQREHQDYEPAPSNSRLPHAIPYVRLWLHWSIFFVGAFAGVSALQRYIPELRGIRWDEAWVGTGICVGIFVICNRVGSNLWMKLAARTGRIGALAIMVLVSIAFGAAITGPGLRLSVALAIVAILGFGCGGFLGAMPQLAEEMLDPGEDFPLRYGVVFSSFGLCAFAAPFWASAQQSSSFIGNVSLFSPSVALLIGFLYILFRPTRRARLLSQSL